jgi:hypothetical protein
VLGDSDQRRKIACRQATASPRIQEQQSLLGGKVVPLALLSGRCQSPPFATAGRTETGAVGFSNQACWIDCRQRMLTAPIAGPIVREGVIGSDVHGTVFRITVYRFLTSGVGPTGFEWRCRLRQHCFWGDGSWRLLPMHRQLISHVCRHLLGIASGCWRC